MFLTLTKRLREFASWSRLQSVADETGINSSPNSEAEGALSVTGTGRLHKTERNQQFHLYYLAIVCQFDEEPQILEKGRVEHVFHFPERKI